MRAVSLHRDVIVVTSALLQVNCVIVRGIVGEGAADAEGEVFVIDSPVLPDDSMRCLRCLSRRASLSERPVGNTRRLGPRPGAARLSRGGAGLCGEHRGAAAALAGRSSARAA